MTTPPLYASRHATCRAVQRYGVEPAPEHWRAALLAIWATCLGDAAGARLIDRDWPRERWAVCVGAYAMDVGYDAERAVIITVLPR